MRRVRRRLTGTALAVVLLGGAVACSDGDGDGAGAAPRSASTASPSASAPSVRPGERLEPLGPVRLGQVVGGLDRDRRRQVLREVGTVTDDWLRAAYLAGPWPRRDFSRAWPRFTPAAERLARADRALTSNADLGRRVTDVVPRSRRIDVDVLVARGWAQAATARVRLAFRAEQRRGPASRGYVVHGRLLLTHGDAGWRVFGYDLSKGAR